MNHFTLCLLYININGTKKAALRKEKDQWILLFPTLLQHILITCKCASPIVSDKCSRFLSLRIMIEAGLGGYKPAGLMVTCWQQTTKLWVTSLLPNLTLAKRALLQVDRLFKKFFTFSNISLDIVVSKITHVQWQMFLLLMAEFSSVQFSWVTQLRPTLGNPMNHSTPGLPVYHQLPEFTQTHVHRVGEAIQSSHPLSSPSPPVPNPSQHQSLFQWVNFSHEVAKVLEFQL